MINYELIFIFSQLGALADVIFKKDMYKDQVGSMLYQHVFPVFQSPHGHLRARVCIITGFYL